MDPALSSDQTAIAAAKEVFWRQGFGNTGVEDLVKVTGFNRYKLYNAFGDKLGIFLAVLDQYYMERRQIFMDGLEDPEVAPLDAIRRVFEFAINEMADREMGCLICNVAAEVGKAEPVISERIGMYLTEIRMAYTRALSRAQELGQLNPAITPEQGAEMLVAIKLGSGTRAKHGATREELHFTFNAAMAAIEKPGWQ